MTRSEFMALVRDTRDEDAEKEALVSFIVKKDENSVGQRTLVGLDYMATGLFASVGTIIAGQAGMNVVGSTLVGCVASMGGGSLNNMLTGSATRGGVFWMKDSLILAIAMGASLATFYLWPLYEEQKANQFCSELHSAIGVTIEERIGDGARGVGYEQFCAALDGDPQLARRIVMACAPHFEREVGRSLLLEAEGARYLFEWLANGSGTLGVPELQLIARWEAMDSPLLYAVESVALGAISVIGAQHGIVRGVRPLACVATGVTICFGGILRDLLCQRPVAIGGQSYALATAAGATVYVGMRQLVVAGYPIPLVNRIALAMGTAVSQRALSFFSGRGVHDSSFLAPMANYHTAPGAAAAPRTASSAAEQLCDAGARGDVRALQRLLHGRHVDPNQGDYDKRTATHLAASEGRWAAVRFLLEEGGADANPLDRWGGTPLDDAMRSKHTLVANYLRSKGGLSGEEIRSRAAATARGSGWFR